MDGSCSHCGTWSRNPCSEYRGDDLKSAFQNCYNLDGRSKLIALGDYDGAEAMDRQNALAILTDALKEIANLDPSSKASQIARKALDDYPYDA
jgi:hypothetical protein